MCKILKLREKLQKKVVDCKEFLENYFNINLDGIENYGKSE